MIPHSRPWITEVEQEAVRRQLGSGMIAEGEAADRFAAEIAVATGAARALLAQSGRAALEFALKTVGTVRGAEVIIPTYVCHEVRDAVLSCGATPVLADIGPHWNMTRDTVARVVGPRTASIVVVHTFGIAASVAPLREFGVPIVEDFCQAFGAVRGGSPAAIEGDAAVYSFHATKCLATGTGGAAAFKDPQRIAAADRLRGAPEAAYVMSDLQAALGSAQLGRYASFLDRRRVIAQRYFADLPRSATGALDAVASESMFFRFPLRCQGGFDAVQRAFAERGIAVRRGVDDLLHRGGPRRDEDFPGATAAFNETVSLPIYPALTDGEVAQVTAAARAILQ